MATTVTITLPFSFTNNTTAYADQVQDDLEEIRDKFNAHFHDELSSAHKVTSSVYGDGTSFGNVASSFTAAGVGAAGRIYAPLVIYQKYGEASPGSNVVATTQAWFSAAAYYGPTSEDSMECGSCFVAAKDTGTPFTQARALTAFEGHAQVEGGNIVTGTMVGIAGRISALDTSQVTNAYSVYSGALTKDAGATITNYYAFYQSAAGTASTNNFGLYAKDKILSEKGVRVLVSTDASMDFRVEQGGSGGGDPAFVFVRNPAGTDFVTLRLNAIAGQTKEIIAAFDSSGNKCFKVNTTGVVISQVGYSVTDTSSRERMQVDSSGNVIVKAVATTADGGMTDSPLVRLTGSYDSDATAAVVNATRNFSLRHTMTAAGASPAGKLSFLNHSGAEAASLTDTGLLTVIGGLSIADAKDVTIGVTTGTKIGQAASKIGFFDATPVVRPSAYTQTYSTADKTHANPTMATLTDSSGGTAADTIAAITTGGTAADQGPTRDAIATLAREQARAKADIADVKQIVNSIIDDLQALGLAA